MYELYIHESHMFCIVLQKSEMQCLIYLQTKKTKPMKQGANEDMPQIKFRTKNKAAQRQWQQYARAFKSWAETTWSNQAP